eukprot:CFRG3282T1
MLFASSLRCARGLPPCALAPRASKCTSVIMKSTLTSYKSPETILSVIGEALPEGVLNPGQFFIHKRHGYRAVVLKVDDRCKQSDSWCSFMGVTEEMRENTWYYCIADSRDTKMDPPHFYVSAANAIGFRSDEPLQNPHSAIFLTRLMNGAHGVQSVISTV